MDQQIPLRRLPLHHTVNTRDLGGYGTADGRCTRFGRVYRSDAPLTVEKSDVALLRSLQITTIIDLRTVDQVEHSPNALAWLPGFFYYKIPFDQGNRNPQGPKDMPVIYGELFSCLGTVRRVLKTIAEAPQGILYHCMVGKDRTGVITALLLLLCGVSADDVLADYEVSYTYIRRAVRQMLLENPAYPPTFGRSDMEYMEKALENFFSAYGSVQDYLCRAGVSLETIALVREKLLGNQAPNQEG